MTQSPFPLWGSVLGQTVKAIDLWPFWVLNPCDKSWGGRTYDGWTRLKLCPLHMRPAAVGTEYGILERSSLNTRTVESTDSELVELVQDVVAVRVLGDVPRDVAAQSCLGRLDSQARV